MNSKQSEISAPSGPHDGKTSPDAYDCVQAGTFDLGATDLPPLLAEVRRGLREAGPIISTERAWRSLERGQEASTTMKVTASRWQALENETRDVEAKTAGGTHLVKIVLRATKLSLHIDGKLIHDGVATPGMVHVTEPGAQPGASSGGRTIRFTCT
ncbi:MAG: hypothetical protein WDN69_24930, partial [Aliidongia sp.]